MTNIMLKWNENAVRHVLNIKESDIWYVCGVCQTKIQTIEIKKIWCEIQIERQSWTILRIMVLYYAYIYMK